MRTSRTKITSKHKWEEKQLYGHFKPLTRNFSHERKTYSLLIAAQINALRTNRIKARIDKTQQNSRCMLCGERDETIDHIISEFSKLAKKDDKNVHDRVD